VAAGDGAAPRVALADLATLRLAGRHRDGEAPWDHLPLADAGHSMPSFFAVRGPQMPSATSLFIAWNASNRRDGVRSVLAVDLPGIDALVAQSALDPAHERTLGARRLEREQIRQRLDRAHVARRRVGEAGTLTM
jgi:hypothetical protein